MTNTEAIKRLVESGLCQNTYMLTTAALASGLPGLMDNVPDITERFYPDAKRREIAVATVFVGETARAKRIDGRNLVGEFIEFINEIGL